jgi:hypothetical protein
MGIWCVQVWFFSLKCALVKVKFETGFVITIGGSDYEKRVFLGLFVNFIEVGASS